MAFFSFQTLVRRRLLPGALWCTAPPDTTACSRRKDPFPPLRPGILLPHSRRSVESNGKFGGCPACGAGTASASAVKRGVPWRRGLAPVVVTADRQLAVAAAHFTACSLSPPLVSFVVRPVASKPGCPVAGTVRLLPEPPLSQPSPQQEDTLQKFRTLTGLSLLGQYEEIKYNPCRSQPSILI